jgi:hypothetical protein
MSKLLEKSIMSAEFARQMFRVTPPAGTKIEEMLDNDYWAHVARKFTPHDILEVVPEDGAFYARLIVVNCAKLWAKMQKLEYVELGSKKGAVASTDLFEAKFSGHNAKWRAVKKSDGSLLSPDSFQTRDEAEQYIEKYSKEMAA